jgi:hypothetical protein
MAANAFTSTFSPDTLGEETMTSEALPMQCIYMMQQDMDSSFFTEVDLK